MEVKFCDKCGEESFETHTIIVDYTKFFYCSKCVDEIRKILVDIRGNAIKTFATRFAGTD